MSATSTGNSTSWLGTRPPKDGWRQLWSPPAYRYVLSFPENFKEVSFFFLLKPFRNYCTNNEDPWESGLLCSVRKPRQEEWLLALLLWNQTNRLGDRLNWLQGEVARIEQIASIWQSSLWLVCCGLLSPWRNYKGQEDWAYSDWEVQSCYMVY